MLPLGWLRLATRPDLTGIAAGAENNGNGRGRRLYRELGRSASAYEDYAYLLADQIGRQFRQSFVLTFTPTVFDRNILAFDIAGLLQALAERRNLLTQRSGRCDV
jgi:hypothetical protein